MTSALQQRPRRTTRTQPTSPWFVAYNSTDGAVHFFECASFPYHRFSPNSPFEDYVIVAHAGIEPYAQQAGFPDVESYLQYMIYSAALGMHPDA